MIGKQLGPYQVVDRLGEGGMGEVWRAKDARLGRDVAIKVLHESVANDAERRERFEREARAVAALSHPNILAIFDIGEHEGQLYVVTELLEGQTLRDRLTDGPMSFRKVVDLGVQVAKGLTAAHDRGIIHRDLKPENLFCTTDGLTKILDFGLARQLTSASDSGATETMAATDPGTILGTVGYMAPEQVRSKAVDARTDLFALGAVLYEAASGDRAFKGDTAADTITAILREDPPETSTSRVDFSPAFDRIVRHCLEKTPEDRFQTARDVAFALTSLSGSTSSQAAGVNPDSATLPVASRVARVSALRIAAIAVVLTAAVAWAVVRSTAPAESPWTYEARTRVEQTIFSSRFMPDDETVIISAAMSGNRPSLYESRTGSAAPRPFGPPATHLLSISSKGELLVLANARYQGQRRFSGTLGRMMVDGTPRALAEDVREADWLPDGSDFVVVRDQGPTDVLEFPAGTPVYTVSGYLSTPRVSPDGRRVAFMEHPQKWDNRGWVKVVDRAGTVTTLAGEHPGQDGLIWSPDGRDILFTAGIDDDYQVYAVAAVGGEAPRAYLSSPASVHVQDRRADGGLLISREIKFYGVAARARTGAPEHDLAPSDLAWATSLSMDGTSVLISDGRGGLDYTVVITPIEGGPGTRLGEGAANDISEDGQWATARRFSTGQCVVHPTGAGAPAIVDTGTTAKCVTAWFMGDASRLFVGVEDTDGKQSAMTMVLPDGRLEPFVWPTGMVQTFPRGLSREGWMVGRDADGNWLVAAPNGSVAAVQGLTPEDRFLRWSADGTSLTIASDGQPTIVSRVDWRTGVRTAIETLVPSERPGMLAFNLLDFVPETGAYVSNLTRRTSALYVAERR